MEPLYSALSSVKVLRSSVGQVFSSLANGLRDDHGEEGKETKFLLELQELLTCVTQQLRDVEQAVNSLTPPPGPFSLGNTSLLSQESSQERQQLYSQVVLSYKWTDKVHEYSSVANNLLHPQVLRRSFSASSAAKKKKVQTSNHNVPPQVVDNLISNLDRIFSDMNFVITRPFATNVVLQVTLDRVLLAVLAFKGMMIEWVIVKAYGEPPDLWTESRYKVFRKITENANAAMLHFFSPTLPDIAVRSFMTWLHSYIRLFNDPCKRCKNHLYNGDLSTWRDFRSLEPYHEQCKP